MTLSSKQPKALSFMFLTEMWERFGFYIIQGLLVLYMTQFYHFSDTKSYTILGVFTALAYISPVIGGILADRLLGFRVSIVWGGLLLVFGYALLALSERELFFYPALATIVIGSGFFKPNISSLLGKQYLQDDPRREAGFTFFYIGINLGAFLAGVSAGYIKNYFGWGTSFALASIGLIIGLITFFFGLRYIQSHEAPHHLTFKHKLQLVAYTLLAIMVVNLIFDIHLIADWLLPIVGIGLLMTLALLTMRHKGEDKKRLLTLNLLIVSSVVFWILYFQMFFSATLYIERLVYKEVLGLHLTTTVFFASESIFIILLGPVFAWGWHALARRKENPSTFSKFIVGTSLGGIAFLVLAISAIYPNANGLVNPFWIFLAYFILTIGELSLSPIGLSAVTHLSPPNLVGMMMGIWFVATGFGGVLAGVVAKISNVPDSVTSTSEILAIYRHAFLFYASIALLTAIIMLFIRFVLNRQLATASFD